VTEKLVKEVLEDTVKVIIDYNSAKKQDKKNIDTGNFRLLLKEKTLDINNVHKVGV
jgi:predicted Ser/Thr protein kinase